MIKYTAEFDDKLSTWVVVEWQKVQTGSWSGKTVDNANSREDAEELASNYALINAFSYFG